MSTKIANIRPVFKGTYSSSASYEYLNEVYYNGSSFVALKDSPVGAPADDGINWRIVASKGADGTDGADGSNGEDFKILGYYASLAALQSAVNSPSAGDAYGVGSAAPYDIYVYDGLNSTWINNGAIQGAAGDDGVSAYLHIRYGTSSTPATLLTTPAEYIGLCVSSSATAPTTYSGYTWYFWKGEAGAKGNPGDTGADGDTPVIAVTSITGGNRVTITVGSSTPQTFDVMNGADGADGTDGTDGADGVSPTIDSAPTSGSGNAVSSGGTYTALASKAGLTSGKVNQDQASADIVTSFSALSELYGKLLVQSSGITITLPSDSTIGQEFEIMRDCSSEVYLTAASGVKIKASVGLSSKVSITSQYGTVAVKHIAAAIWHVSGDVTQVTATS